MARGPSRGVVTITAIVLFITFIFYLRHPSSPGIEHTTGNQENGLETPAGDNVNASPEVLNGGVVMGKLGNETAKAELGRAAWKLLHTTMARFPENPTEDEKEALKSYIWLFARLYPCGECAAHFQEILKKYPPQTSSRNTAVGWACFVHNEVNKRKNKPLFDCNNIGDFYDCGCADDEETKAPSDKAAKVGKKEESVEISKEGSVKSV
ncbi:putative fad dependent sulfhydryl oxidase erv2 [Phaeomoniella chlamydospora]|uniref:Sulfhydryl oxidase n=1 Tax=Phaeomoniella chlamydospora TaxID=158046 RepID=A0A0G2FT18_PHACM|nr:putative fad dependent sulfhydryl oxidase erv2 [Phaeomoniella chlamydospora]